jgi:hypothetical protein
MPRASHHARVCPRCGFLAIERRPVGLERGPAGGRARGGPCSIRGPDCVALLSPLRVRGDSGIHDRASSETLDYRAHLNERRSASTGSTAGTPNAVKVSLRASWTRRGFRPCATASKCLKCRGSTVATSIASMGYRRRDRTREVPGQWPRCSERLAVAVAECWNGSRSSSAVTPPTSMLRGPRGQQLASRSANPSPSSRRGARTRPRFPSVASVLLSRWTADRGT